MYIEAVPNRNSPPAVLLRETYREGGKIKKRTLLNLTSWPAEQVEGLRIILKGGTALPPGERPFAIARSLPHGHVAAVLGAIRDDWPRSHPWSRKQPALQTRPGDDHQPDHCPGLQAGHGANAR